MRVRYTSGSRTRQHDDRSDPTYKTVAEEGGEAQNGNAVEYRMIKMMGAMTFILSKEKAETESRLNRLEDTIQSLAGKEFRSGREREFGVSTRAAVVAAREVEDRGDPTGSVVDRKIVDDNVAESSRRESITRKTHTPPPLRRVYSIVHEVVHEDFFQRLTVAQTSTLYG